MEIFKKIFFLLDSAERKRAILLLFMTLIMAFLDMIGVASIMPFITVLTNPDIIEQNYLFRYLYKKLSIFGVDNEEEFKIAIGLSVFFVLLASLTFKSLTIYAQIRFAHMREYSIGKRLMHGYLSQPYTWSLNRNSADLSKNIFSETSLVIHRGLVPAIIFITSTAISLVMLMLLIVIDPKIAFLITFTFGLSYWIIYKFVRGYLNIIGDKRLKVNRLRFTAANEAFGAEKAVKLGGLEDVYIDRFSKAAKAFSKYQSNSFILSQLPRFVIEALAFGGIILVILYYLIKTSTFVNALPLIAVYAFAGYRMLPALQGIYNSISQIRFTAPAINNLYEELKLDKSIIIQKKESILPFEKAIRLNNISYNYPNTPQSSLKNIVLEIPIYSKVAFVGATGSGKTTTADVILGLLEPQSGSLEIDGKIISHNNKRAWQKLIGHVPQHIYLTDATILENIALGVDLNEIDQEAVKHCAKIANLHEFIENKLPLGYKTLIGENGTRLSGGERQRLGIARALYHNPKILVLDEATSAMDNLTEKAIVDTINKLRKDKTIILIAHRLNTIKNCDKIFLLDKGELIKQGNFEELMETSNLFKKNVNT
jgi:ABC-type multidrug transport system fused ATPase/permease subunit